jgi:glucose-6-phosphate isomerase
MQIDLTERSGLPISLNLETGKLDATGDVDLGEQGERRLSQLREVLADPDAATDDRICYRTYRGVGTTVDKELLDQHGLRYDLTVTLPGTTGREFIKTAGHYHSTAPDGIVYPELYEVVYGEAAFVLQGGVRETDGRVQLCKAGEAIVIPPNCGHVTANVGDKPLVVCDLIASACTNDYGSYREKRGAAYYVVEIPGSLTAIKNQHYPQNEKPAIAYGSRWPMILPSDAPLIELFRRNPETFRLLTTPGLFLDPMWMCWSY